MRNWNYWNSAGVSICPKGFYSTYEELKLECYIYSNLLICGFLQYLWGIETSTCDLLNGFIMLFLQYLWGIETIWRNGITTVYYSVFTVPMRNWNICHSLYKKFNFLFLQYLWGIETLCATSRPRIHPRFYSTYEELKQICLKSPLYNPM